MPNGSEDSGMVMQVTMPGYKMPEGADVSTEEGFRAWVEKNFVQIDTHTGPYKHFFCYRLYLSHAAG